jgi:hypothetical protein
VAICLFDAIVALNVSKIKKKNEYFCIFLSLPIYCRCFADFYETMFSGPRRFFRRNDFCNTGLSRNFSIWKIIGKKITTYVFPLGFQASNFIILDMKQVELTICIHSQ